MTLNLDHAPTRDAFALGFHREVKRPLVTDGAGKAVLGFTVSNERDRLPVLRDAGHDPSMQRGRGGISASAGAGQ